MNKIYFVCFTVYHLFVALYYASKIQKGNNKTVLIWYQKDDVDVSRFSPLFDEIYVIENEKKDLRRFWIKLKTRGYLAGIYYNKEIFCADDSADRKILCVFSDEHEATWRIMRKFSGSKDKIILIEEGMGTYALYERPFSYRKLLNRILFGLKGEENIGTSPLISSYIVKDPDALPEKKHRGRPVIKQNTMFDDSDWIKSLNVLGSESKTALSRFSGKRILWLGQPLDNLRVEEETEIRVTERIIGSFPSDHSFIIKKHPRDNAGKYDHFKGNNICKYFIDHETWVPVEVLVSEIEPDIIITPLSSAATNLYEIGYGKTIIFCYKLFGIEIDDRWLEKYKDNSDIHNVGSFDELNRIISETGSSPERKNTQDLTVNENKDIDYLNGLISGSAE